MKVTLKDGSIFEGTPGEYLEMIASLSDREDFEVYERNTESNMETNEEFPFKIGDIVRGKPGQERYTFTNQEMTKGEVVYVSDSGKITVRVLEHKKEFLVGEEFYGLEPKYFEKVKEESAEIDDGEALKVGDYAEVISKEGFFWVDYKVGDIVRLVEDDGSYVVRFERLSDGLRDWMDKREVRKIDVTEYNGKKYVEVKRKAREGELIKVVNSSTTFGEYGNGDVLVVKDVEQNAEHGPYGVDAEAIEVFILHEEYVVLEPIGTHKTEAIVKFADGSKKVFRDVESVELSTE